MKATYEIHCQRCGVLLRQSQHAVKECPDCGDPQVIALYWAPGDSTMQRRCNDAILPDMRDELRELPKI